MNQKKELAVFGDFSGYLEDTVCPICTSPPAPKRIFTKSEGIDILICGGCGIYYASPRFDEPSLLTIYETEEFSDMSFYDNWNYDDWSQSGARGWVGSNLKTQLVKRYLQDGDSLLDVGCGTGELVLVAGKNNIKAVGIDNSKMLIEVGQKILKSNVLQVDIKDYHPSHKFKGVMIWDVLEHLSDPVGMLKMCADLLEPNGFLIAQVPNFRGLSNKLKSFACRTGLSKNNFGHFGFPYHLYFFDKRSLSKLVNASGLEAIHFESWSHLLKDGKKGFLNDIIISVTKKYCLSDYIIVIAQKKS